MPAGKKIPARLTDIRIKLTEEERTILVAKLRKAIETKEAVCIACFVLDNRRFGGACAQAERQVKKIDSISGVARLTDGQDIPIEDIFMINEAREI